MSTASLVEIPNGVYRRHLAKTYKNKWVDLIFREFPVLEKFSVGGCCSGSDFRSNWAHAHSGRWDKTICFSDKLHVWNIMHSDGTPGHTLIHEVAHLLTPNTARTSTGRLRRVCHGPLWKEKFRNLLHFYNYDIPCRNGRIKFYNAMWIPRHLRKTEHEALYESIVGEKKSVKREVKKKVMPKKRCSTCNKVVYALHTRKVWNAYFMITYVCRECYKLKRHKEF